LAEDFESLRFLGMCVS